MQLQTTIFEFKWRIFYSVLTYFLTFIICIDSWEYLLIFEINFLSDLNIAQNKSNLIFSQLMDGQKLIYFLSFYYSFLISSFFIFIQILILFLPALFKTELINFIFYIIFYLHFLLSHFLNNKYFFPLICKDLLQYQYNHLSDRILNINIEYLMNINDIIFLKIKISLILGIIFNSIYIIYCLNLKNGYILNFFMKNRKIIYILWLIVIFFFFENEVYLTIFFFLLSFFLCEFYFLLTIILKTYFSNYKIR